MEAPVVTADLTAELEETVRSCADGDVVNGIVDVLVSRGIVSLP